MTLRYTHLLFDADNTLFDFDQAQEVSLRSAVKELCGKFNESWLDTYSKISVQCWREFEAGLISIDQLKLRRFKEFTDTTNIDVDPKRLGDSYMQKLSQCSMLLDHCEPVLQEFSAKGCKMAIVTNGLSMIQRPRFKQSPITPLFDAIIISDEIGVAKPHPRIFEVAMEQLGSDNYNRTLMIGDNLLSDIEGANKFGIDSCWMNPDGRRNCESVKPTYQIKCLTQLLELVCANE